MSILVLVFFLCLVLSAFCSASEMAFVSVNQMKVRQRADQGEARAKRIALLLKKPQQFLSAILVLNNIVNVTATAALTIFFQMCFSIENEWVVTLVMVPIFLIFAEMVPKEYGRMRSENFLLTWAGVIEFWMSALHLPVQWILGAAEKMLGRFKGVLQKNIFVSQNEFRSLIEEGAKSGVLDAHERHLINTILDFERIQLSSVMIPLDRVVKVEIVARVGDVRRLVQAHHSRMVLVYEEVPSIVMGMIYVYDLLFEHDLNKSLKEYLRSPIFLPANTSIEKAFLTLQQKRQSYSVVVDASFEAVGVVPIERLIDF